MSQKTVLITGGAGFIGSHLADELLRCGYHVIALDNLSPQVHGPNARRPDYLADEVELIVGDVRDADIVRRAIRRADAVFHLAAVVGVGQSMYEILKYTDVNDIGTAVLLQQLMRYPVKKLIVASSMSVYGEGLYRNSSGAPVIAAQRNLKDLKAQRWEPVDSDGKDFIPLPTPESKPVALSSIYAVNKYVQEQMCLISGPTTGATVTALRFFNVYGPRQALSNPYTGVLAIFGARYLNRRAPVIFEDGEQRRDFVHVRDVARACRLTLESNGAVNRETLNIGSGRAVTVKQIAAKLGEALDCTDIEPEISLKYRVGDIRHCYADISRARELLGYEPMIDLDQGIAELAVWLRSETANDTFDIAAQELSNRGLTV